MNFEELETEVFKAAVESKKDIFLLDVREEYEFEDDNIGGTNIPMGEVLSKVDEFKAYDHIYVICKSGKRSQAIGYHLSKALNNSTIYSCCGGIQAYTELS